DLRHCARGSKERNRRCAFLAAPSPRSKRKARRDDPLGGIHRMIVLEAEMAEAFRDGFKARRFGLLIEAIVGVGAVDDLAQQRERGVIAQLVLLQERLE